MVSRHLGIGYESFFVLAFRHLKSMQNLKVPSFFHTSTTALHQGDCEGHMAPPSNISCMCWHTSSTSCCAILLDLSLNGSSCSGSSSMKCSVALVQPISFFSKQKIWWNSIRSHLALRAVSFFQPFNFLRLPFSSNTFIRSSWLSFQLWWGHCIWH